tara:strand:+ start:1203 stop:1583 length:381 start_codon:yes stop_codon:yes gene_type:complete
MKNIKKVAVLVIIAVGFLSFKGIQHHVKVEQEVNALFADTITAFEQKMNANSALAIVNPNDITVIEEEETVELGFDTFEYLPIEFDAYAGMNLTDKDFEIFENEEIVDFDFDTAAYLPADFNAYAL